MLGETEIQRVELWRHEWNSSESLRTTFPSLATYLVFKASECGEFGKLRPSRRLGRRSKPFMG